MSEQSRYPRDEFDDVEPGDGRRGAHRARPNPVLAMVPVLLVVVAVVALVVGAMTLLGGNGPDVATRVSEPTGTSTETAGSPTSEGGTTTPGTPAPTATDAPTDAQTGTPTDAQPEPEPPAEEPAPVDRSVGVRVLNGTTTAGLAGGAAEVLGADGWTVTEVDNYRAGPTPPTTVYYADETLAATAEALADALGGAATELSDAFGGGGLTVVLGEDYQP